VSTDREWFIERRGHRLGYIGLPTAVSLATGGLEVTGVDVNPEIVEGQPR